MFAFWLKLVMEDSMAVPFIPDFVSEFCDGVLLDVVLESEWETIDMQILFVRKNFITNLGADMVITLGNIAVTHTVHMLLEEANISRENLDVTMFYNHSNISELNRRYFICGQLEGKHQFKKDLKVYRTDPAVYSKNLSLILLAMNLADSKTFSFYTNSDEVHVLRSVKDKFIFFNMGINLDVMTL